MTYTVRPARYARGKLAVHCPPDGSLMKTPPAAMIDALGGRWSGRESAYIASPRQVKDMEILLAAGWRGRNGIFAGQPSRYWHSDYPGEYARARAVHLAKNKLQK